MTLRVGWCTDIHLNFLRGGDYLEFLQRELGRHSLDALFITGDIAEAPNVADYLTTMEEFLMRPIYFVFGNHDYYLGSIEQVRDWGEKATLNKENKLNWMPAAGVVSLSDSTAVVGVDGWGDAKFGDPEGSQVFLNDWVQIRELLFSGPMSLTTHLDQRIPALRELGRQEAETLRGPLKEALETHSKVFVLTHVPPWIEATWHRGAHSDANWLPWFSCKAVGDVIVELAAQYPNTEVTVLCGHTHGGGESRISDNVLAITGGARYHHPKLNQVFEIGDNS